MDSQFPSNKEMSINMKSSYLYALLLLLLLVDKSLSVGFSPVGKIISKKLFKRIYPWKKPIENEFPPNPQQVKQIPGLSQIKDYLSWFGYLQDSGPFNDSLDQDTTSAIVTYQQYFNLNVTGDLNNETLQHISLPRCGVPDRNFTYDLTTSNLSWPQGNEWFPRDRKNLTYGFLNASQIPENATKVFRDAFTRWSETTRLVNLTETNYDDANIKVGFYNLSDILYGALVGAAIIELQSDSGVKTGEMLLDGTKYWVLPTYNNTWSWQQNEFDLETVAMHQIGHLLGLDHSFDEESIMYPAILPSQQRKVQITDDDNNSIHQLYTNSSNGGHSALFGSSSELLTSFSHDGHFALFGSSSGLLTSFSLGFASMVLLH